jgi:hypothetical protein
MQSAGDRPQLLERGGDLLARLIDLGAGAGVVSKPLLESLQVQRQ